MNLFVDAHVFDDLNQGSKTYLKGLYNSVLKLDTKDNYYFAAHHSDVVKRELDPVANAHFLTYSSTGRFKRLGFEITSLIKNHHVDFAHFQYTAPLRKVCKE